MSCRLWTGVRLSEMKRAAEEQCVEPSFEGDERWRRDERQMADRSKRELQRLRKRGRRRWRVASVERAARASKRNGSRRLRSMSATRHSSAHNRKASDALCMLVEREVKSFQSFPNHTPRGVMCPRCDFWFWRCIYRLLVYIVRFPSLTYLFLWQ